MLQVFVESRAARPRSASWAAVSFIAHSALVGAAVLLTARVTPEARAPETIHVVRYTPAAPVERATSAPISAAVPRAISVPSFSIPRIPFDIPEHRPAQIIGQLLDDLRNIAPGSSFGTDPGVVESRGAIYTEATVDRMVAPSAGNPSPAYPARLASAGVEGDALVRFVVDTAGRVEPASVEILSASHALFAASVRRWLGQTRYSPALVQGRPVRQLVQQRVGFSLAR
jgi:TonB family protein